jgi:hypothetical protein
MSHLVAPLVPRHCSLSTPLITLVLVLPMMPSRRRVEELVNSTVSLMCTRRLSLPTVSRVSTVVSFLQSLVSLSTVVFTSVYMIHLVSCLNQPLIISLILIAEPVVLVGALEGSFLASFALGWGVTIGAGLASYPLDTIR